MHQGHRERMRKRIAENGLDSLADHEILEYLLYFIMPRKDTNAIAHRLLNHFNSLHRVLDADPDSLCAVEDVGYKTAQFLTELPALFRCYERSRISAGITFHSLANLIDWLTPIYYGSNEEIMVLVCMDAGYRLIHEERWKHGSATETTVNIKEMVAIALKYNAVKVACSHNHLTNIPHPSANDQSFTTDLKFAMGLMDIELTDHIIICPNGEYFSFLENHRL